MMEYAILSHISWLVLQLALLHKCKPTIDEQGNFESRRILMAITYSMIFVFVTTAAAVFIMVGSSVFLGYMVDPDVYPGYIGAQIAWVFVGWIHFVYRPLQHEAGTLRKLIN